jgi:hypothetical protein
MRAGAGRAVLAPGSIAQIASRNAIFALVGPGRPAALVLVAESGGCLQGPAKVTQIG